MLAREWGRRAVAAAGGEFRDGWRCDGAVPASTEVLKQWDTTVGRRAVKVRLCAGLGSGRSGVGSHIGRALECMAGEDVSGGFRTNGGKGLKLSGLTDERLKFCSVQRDSTVN